MKRLIRFDFKKSILLFTFGIILICAFPANSAIYAQQPQQQLQQQIIGVKITSPVASQQVPAGELTISGISTDNVTTDCTVYADWNDQKPFQKAVATGPRGLDDYSTWNFTYTADYYLITNGTNDLTSKLSCVGDDSNVGTANLTKSYSVNVIGVTESSERQELDKEEVQQNNDSNNTAATTTPPEHPTIYWDLEDFE